VELSTCTGGRGVEKENCIANVEKLLPPKSIVRIIPEQKLMYVSIFEQKFEISKRGAKYFLRISA
jgi:hypothetical protein